MKKVKDTNTEYHSSDHLGKSQLFQMSKSPAHFLYNLQNPKNQTKSFVFGSAFHCFILEPELFEEEYIVIPDVDKRTKTGRELITQAEKTGKKLLPISDFRTISEMRDSLMKTKYATALLNGEKEMSYYWTDEMTGIKVKCRPDCRRTIKDGKGIIVDLKSCQSAATDDFMRDAVKYGYDLQSAQYKTGVELIEGFPHDFVFIAVEKEPPYGVNILQADELFIQRGYDLFRLFLGTAEHCKNTGNWWSYNGENGIINTLALPAWLLKEME